MPLAQGYAVLKGHAVRGIPAPPGKDHYSVHVVDDELDYRIAINVRSNAKNFGKYLWFFLNEDFHHPIIASLKELPPRDILTSKIQSSQSLNVLFLYI